MTSWRYYVINTYFGGYPAFMGEFVVWFPWFGLKVGLANREVFASDIYVGKMFEVLYKFLELGKRNFVGMFRIIDRRFQKNEKK